MHGMYLFWDPGFDFYDSSDVATRTTPAWGSFVEPTLHACLACKALTYKHNVFVRNSIDVTCT